MPRMTLVDTKDGGYRTVSIPRELGERFEALVVKGLPSYRSIWRAMRFARKASGLPMTQPTHAHRHTTATQLTKMGHSTAVVQQILGHSTPATTMLYIDVDQETKDEALRSLEIMRPSIKPYGDTSSCGSHTGGN